MFVLLAVVFGFTLSYGFYHDFNYFAREALPKLNITQLFFSQLSNYQVNATHITEATYPWIAKIIHSSTSDVPYICSASCVKERIFITAARCLYTLKVKYTSVIYQNKHHLHAQVFVTPSNGTRHGFDDVGFIVVEIPKETIAWEEVQLYGDLARTGSDYEWFLKVPAEGFTAVGYATEADIQNIKSVHVPYNLTELKVIVGLDLCAKIYTDATKEIYHVPCYHSCTVDQYEDQVPECFNYHGVEGGAVIETNSKKLLGVTTWGVVYKDLLLPVGLSVVNSENFYKDYKCATTIANEKTTQTEPLYWQRLCDKL